MLIFFSLRIKSPEFFKCEGLIVPSRGVRILARALAILWGVLPIPEMIGLMGV